MKKLLIIAAATTALAGSGFGALAVAHADSSSAGTTKQARAGMRQDRHIRIDTRLNQAVRDGTITTAQKTAFAAEVKTLRTTEKASLKSATTKTERQAARQTFRTNLESWAKTNNFPLTKIFPKL